MTAGSGLASLFEERCARSGFLERQWLQIERERGLGIERGSSGRKTRGLDATAIARQVPLQHRSDPPFRHVKNQMAATTSTATMATIHVKPLQALGGPAATPAPGGVPPPPVPLPVACARADEAVRRMKPTSVVNSEWRIRGALRRADSERTSTPRDAWPCRWSQPKKRPVVRQVWRSGATDEHGANPRSPVRVSSLWPVHIGIPLRTRKAGLKTLSARVGFDQRAAASADVTPTDVLRAARLAAARFEPNSVCRS